MLFRFDTEVPLRWVDVDSLGVVNNAVYLSLIEQARYAYFEQLGLLRDHRVPFLLAEVTVQFQRPGHFGMPIQVAVRTSELGRTSCRMDYEVRSGEWVLAKARAVLVFVDDAHKPSPVPGAFREAIETFEQLNG